MSSERYGNLSTIVKDAVKNKADILVLPEAYVPFQWIKMLSQVSRKNQMAIITGVEHIKSKKKVYNLVATILPYTNQDKDQEYQYSIVLFHTKVHYSPMELDKMSGYRLSKANGNTYDLFVWNDLWFATYCCYELTSIKERSLFMAYADMLAVVEWNMDTNYYSNIIESLSRDIHCYCVQVNSSNYGDSRVTQPSKTETKDILRTKGGINNTVLIGNINIDRLREFQYLDYAHQKRDDAFKPTPPNYDYYIKENVIRNKINGKLWKSIRRKINL
jgi:predicted amidohydrolase